MKTILAAGVLLLAQSVFNTGATPAPRCSDAVFLRRAYVDVIGTLPTADEARAFLADPDPNKRAALVDRLLAREEFADYWAMKWSDALRVKSEFPINLWPNAVQAYHHWIRASIRDNVPYDRFARELLTESGSNFRVPPVNFYRAIPNRDPEAIAGAVALTFMDPRAEDWPAGRRAQMAAFFSRIGYKATDEWKEEIVYFDPLKAPSPRATLPDGTTVAIPPDRDPREIFTDWLVAPGNPWFARNAVNRVWSWLLGRPIEQESVADVLSRELVASRYDLKQVYRLILNSTTYQLASAEPRPLEAEVLIDALDQITGTTEEYQSAIPEPFTFIPADQRAIQLADGSITSSFLEMFGRPARDTGLDSERNTRPTATARLHMLNSSHVQRKIEQGPKLQAIVQARGDVTQMVTTLYLTILSRYPTEAELKAAVAYPAANKRIAGMDVAWALINSPEFLYRH